jgi:hypothetical protein
MTGRPLSPPTVGDGQIVKYGGPSVVGSEKMLELLSLQKLVRPHLFLTRSRASTNT